MITLPFPLWMPIDSATPLLSETRPSVLPLPRFQLGQFVVWADTQTQDYGQIVGVVYALETSIHAMGYHYAICLAPDSPSYGDGIYGDWGYEGDLALRPDVDARLLFIPS